ncbi:helix-turn-helix transcriptional regulator [Terrarubrum flagellatum]|uniref:helix-turn-helix transcriptional regulator n=1 Tax=Terrirubrum flagellatum TaxID=2895980 RepID=UPI0031451A46
MGEISAAALASAADRLFESAVAGDGWVDALTAYSEAAGARGGVLMTEIDARGALPHTYNVLPTASVAEPVAEYVAGKTPPDPRASRVWPNSIEGFVTDLETFSEGEIKRDAFYQDFLHPIGFGWHACAHLQEWPGGRHFYLSLKRAYRDGHYQRPQIALINASLPALRNAAIVAHARYNSETSGYTQALGSRGEAIFEIDATARMLRCNEAGAALLSASDITLVHGRLAAQRNDDHRRLERATAPALARPAASGFAVLSTNDAARRLVVRTMPVIGDARTVFGAAMALVIVEIWRQPDAPSAQFVRALREAFGLTQMEAHVASLIAAGVSPAMTARALKIAEGTARNHLKAAMAKAGVARQAELAAITARLVG